MNATDPHLIWNIVIAVTAVYTVLSGILVGIANLIFGFGKNKEKLDNIEKGLDKLNGRFDKLSDRVDMVSNRVDKLFELQVNSAPIGTKIPRKLNA